MNKLSLLFIQLFESLAKTYENADDYLYGGQVSQEQMMRQAHKPQWMNAFGEFIERFVYQGQGWQFHQ